jgi:hypothetical protein
MTDRRLREISAEVPKVATPHAVTREEAGRA